jgi:isocitrate dehydrogenase
MRSIKARNFNIIGMPMTSDELRELEPFEFQNWVIQRLFGRGSSARESLAVDVTAMMLSRDPERFQIIVAPNLYGDILSGIAASKIGGVGMAPSGCVGKNFAYFEPVHGTAWDLAGKNIANPIASILSAGMLLGWLGETTGAWYVESAVREVIFEGKVLTADLGGVCSTSSVGDAIAEKIIEIESERRALKEELFKVSDNLIQSEEDSVEQYRREDVLIR